MNTFPQNRVFLGYHGWGKRTDAEAKVGTGFALYRTYMSQIGGDRTFLSPAVLEMLGAGIIPILSWKPTPWTWGEVANGDADAWHKREVTKLRSALDAPGHENWRIIMLPHHEPEGEEDAREFAPGKARGKEAGAVYKRFFARCFRLLGMDGEDYRPHPRIRTSYTVVSEYDLSTGYFGAYNPDGTTDEGIAVDVDYLGWDPYTWCPSPSEKFRSIVDGIHRHCNDYGKPYILAETGRWKVDSNAASLAAQGRWWGGESNPDSLHAALGDYKLQRSTGLGCAGVCPFDVNYPGHCDWRLGAPAWEQFRQIAVDDRFRGRELA